MGMAKSFVVREVRVHRRERKEAEVAKSVRMASKFDPRECVR